MAFAGFFGPPDVENLRHRQDIRGVKGLIEALRYRDAGIRQAAATALGERLGNSLVVGPLVSALGDENDAVREAAAVSLGRLGDPQAIDALIGALRDGTAAVRKVAVTALGRVGDERAIAPLTALHGDPDRHVSSIVDSAVKSIRRRPYLALAEMVASPSDSRHDYALGKLQEAANDDCAVDAMIEVVARDSWGRHELARLLIEAGASRAFPLLKRLADRGSFDGYARMVQSIDEFIGLHPELQQPAPQVECALCGKTVAITTATAYGRGGSERWFCRDGCWAQRGTVLSEIGGCPHLRDGDCSGGGECSMRDGSYRTCHVFRLAGG